MWTIAAVNKKFEGPLGSYNSLTDTHLAHYFSKPFRRNHLKAANLITEDGLIIPDRNVKIDTYFKEKKRKVYDILASTILQNAIHNEGSWNKKICSYLDDVSKMTSVDKARKMLKKKSSKIADESLNRPATTLKSTSKETAITEMKRNKSNNSVCYSAPATGLSLTDDGYHKVANFKRCISAVDYSPYVPLLFNGSYRDCALSIITALKSANHKKRKRKLRSSSKKILEQEIPLKDEINVSFSFKNLTERFCKLTLHYYGHLSSVHLKRDIVRSILIKQQHRGGTPVVVFKGQIAANETITFPVLDHGDFFFSIIIFLDGIRELKLSSCCVFRYAPGRRLGGTNGSFSVKEIQGGVPCLKCQYHNFENKVLYEDHFKSNQEAEDLFPDKITIPALNYEKVNVQKWSEDASETGLSNETVLPAKDNEISEFMANVMNLDEEIEEVPEIKTQDEDSNDQPVEEISESALNSNQENLSKSDTESDISELLEKPQIRTYDAVYDSSSLDEGGNEHIVTVSIHESPLEN